MQIGENRKALAENEKQKTERVLSRKKDQAEVKAFLSPVATVLDQPILSQVVGELQFLIRHRNCGSQCASKLRIGDLSHEPSKPPRIKPRR
jgi:hypothetical protein